MNYRIYFDDNIAKAEHGKRSLQSAAIVLSARAINGLIQIGSILFLARLLSPVDYGLVGMVLAITGFAPVLVDLGTRDAVVQRERITPSEISALFWITLGTGIALALLVAACGPLLAWFYNEPRLTKITAISSLTFVTTALACQHSALLRRAMMFNTIARIDVAANLVSVTIIIAMAYYGFEYWALVVRSISVTLLTAGGLWFYCRWVPTKPVMTAGVREMVRFGFSLVGSSMTEYAGRNGDRVAIGKMNGAHALGLYQNAVLVYSNALDLAFSLHDVATVSLSKLKDNRGELLRLWSKAVLMLAFFGMPAFGLLAVTGQDLVVIVLGSKWTEAGVLLSVLALRGIPHVVERSIGWLHVAAGRTDRWMRWGFIATGAQFVALFAGLPFGPMGVVTAYVVCMFILFVPALAYAGRPFGIVTGDVLKAMRGPLVAALIAVTIGFLLQNTLLAPYGRLSRMAVLTFAFLTTYIGVTFGVFRIRDPIQAAFSILGDILSNFFAPYLGTASGTKPNSIGSDEEPKEVVERENTPNIVASGAVARDELLVSILIPAYNAENWIIDSIESAISQTWPNTEIIVVDDGSTDRTLSVARKYASDTIRIVTQPNRGAAAARNLAFSLCHGAYVQWLDADDILHPEKIAKQMLAVENKRGSRKMLSSRWGSFYHRINKAVFSPSPLWTDLSPRDWLQTKMETNCYMQTATWLVSRELSEIAGIWDTRMLGDDDGEYFCRVLLASEGVRFVPESNVYYRLPGTYSLSYLGHSKKRIEAQLLSCQLHINYLRSLEDSERTRLACREFLANQLSYCHPGLPDLFERSRQLAISLGGEFVAPRLNWRYAWIQKAFGWNTAMRVQSKLPHVKRSIMRTWDKVMAYLEPTNSFNKLAPQSIGKNQYVAPTRT